MRRTDSRDGMLQTSYKLTLLLTILVLLAVACASRKPSPDGTPGDSEAPLVLVRLSGSNTIGAELAPSLAEAWLAAKRATGISRVKGAKADEVRVTAKLDGKPVAVDIKAHGSQTAFSDLAGSACDIGMASRKIKDAEAEDLRSRGRGDLTSNAGERVIGLDGVAVIVHQTNPISVMSVDEVADIFSGTGNTGEWHVYARDDKSGTYDTFKDRVLRGAKLVGTAKRFEDSRELVAAVSQDPKAIGFVGLPYAVGVNKLQIKEKGAMAVAPTVLTVREQSYPLARKLFFYVPGDTKAEPRAFVEFAISPAGQEVVQKAGFVGQIIEQAKVTPPADSPKGYMQLTPSADKLSTVFYFRTGSRVLDSKGVDDIARVVTYLSAQNDGRGIVLVGFADSTGNADANLRLSIDRARAVAEQLRPHGIDPKGVTGFGQALPIADNSTAEGREKNRRVEVWLQH